VARPASPILAALLVAACLLAAAPAAARRAAPLIRVELPVLVREGEPQLTSGTVAHAPAGSLAALQRQAPSGRWITVASSPVRDGRFTVGWRAARYDTVMRVLLERRRVAFGATLPSRVLVGPAPRYCAGVVPNAPPAGDGAVQGGVYTDGGPAPGVVECREEPSTLAAYDAAGMLVAEAPVASGRDYVIDLPPGAYTLRDGACAGQATVLAGRVTVADTVCDVP